MTTSDAILAELRGLRGAPDSLARARARAARAAAALLVVAAPARLPALRARRGAGGRRARPRRRRAARRARRRILSGARGDRPDAARVDAGARTRSRTHQCGGRYAFGASKALSPQALRALPPSSTRLNKYEAWLRVRVADDRLAERDDAGDADRARLRRLRRVGRHEHARASRARRRSCCACR